MALHRREGSRNVLRGVLAFFWIALAGVSGVYLYSALANPAALDSQLANPLPLGSGEMTSAFNGSGSRDRELSEIKASLRQLTQQMAAISTKLNLDPNALTSAEDSTDAEAAAEPEIPPAPSPEAEEPAVAAATPAPPPPPAAPVEQAKPAEAPKPEPQPDAKPVEQAALDVKPAPKPLEPPAVAVAPIDDLPVEEEAEANTDAPAPTPPPAAAEPVPAPTPTTTPPVPEPSTPAPTESAALDPVALPPAANDGSTRYGIEIGVVDKQDGLRPLWREFLTKHAALVAGLQPRRVLAPDKKWRLIAGPFTSAAEASQACALFKKASRPCEATVYAGDSL
jgi:hypothetical protein